jgi:hypothetical protein
MISVIPRLVRIPFGTNFTMVQWWYSSQEILQVVILVGSPLKEQQRS